MLTRITDRRALRRWTRAARDVDRLDAPALKDLQRQANRLSRRLTYAMAAAEHRLQANTCTMRPANQTHPTHTDWSWRPSLWSAPYHPGGKTQIASATRLGAEAAIFHDCPRDEITLRQNKADTLDAPAPYSATIDVLGFEGSYLSLALDLPRSAIQSLSGRHIFSLSTDVSAERDVDIYARLNLRHGPNVSHVTCRLDQKEGLQTSEFDLANAGIDAQRLNRAWLDLIFEVPAYNNITLKTVSLSRRPRAEV